MGKQLTPRKEAILRSLVEEYIRSATPVASETLRSKYHLPWGAATVRNEMASLEEEGLLFQPHTSAGRIPTDLGYRYFVEHLMLESALSLDEQRQIRHQFYQVQHQLDEWVRLTASVLSRALQSAAVVTPPRAAEGRLKHFEVLALQEMVALLVVVLQDGAVKQERLFLNAPTTQDELSALSQQFNRLFVDMTGPELERWAEDMIPGTNEQVLVRTIARLLAQHGSAASETFYHDGILQMLNQPEFTTLGAEHERNQRIRKVVEVLEQNRLLPALAEQVPVGGVQVIIGGESEFEDMKDVSLVVSRYGREGQISGVLGVVGPTRMQYSRAIAVVRYMTEVLNDLLAEL
jgi:heat-inducible transcriptional repressor